jgi:hypothetical protein
MVGHRQGRYRISALVRKLLLLSTRWRNVPGPFALRRTFARTFWGRPNTRVTIRQIDHKRANREFMSRSNRPYGFTCSQAYPSNSEFGRWAWSFSVRVIGIAPRRVSDWFSGRVLPTLTYGLRIQSFLEGQKVRKEKKVASELQLLTILKTFGCLTDDGILTGSSA